MEKAKSMNLLAIFFDLDNTLIPTRKADEAVCNKLTVMLITKHSVPVDLAPVICTKYLETFRKCPDNPVMNLDTWRQLLWEQALGEHYKYLTGIMYQTWLELRLEYLALTSEIKRLLVNLRKNYLIGLITNGPSCAQWEKVNKLNLKPFFDLILVSGDLPWEKPHEKIFLKACNNLGVKPQQCIIVGDKLETDILGGIRSKLAGSVWIPLGSRKLRENDPVPNFIIDNVLELPPLLPQRKSVNACEQGGMAKHEFLASDVEDCNSNSSDGS